MFSSSLSSLISSRHTSSSLLFRGRGFGFMVSSGNSTYSTSLQMLAIDGLELSFFDDVVGSSGSTSFLSY